ncbi:hypothetical protein L226DRAFT_576561 [Lentinus tigrinus ALCF2SS1-7]|uniref:Uncharacterized protein n=1 Tax=Lentinus tigrinus ALCF2SS1-6 TaxID=1328759 RepID=A0A5C2RRR7_9APHY|nr:hypothetical protein L227DRAFT_617467 [Lentinus tigrinus ALCF2SS1-6]RPD68263.1 hypothetical protein L226DRAFT_576561 [Lentinus tigrinus ALCF2SS1-7]
MPPPLTIDERLRIIKEIDISRPRPRPRFIPRDNVPGAAVSDGSSISFVGNLTAQMQADVVNSTLFAQLAANQSYNRQTQFLDWYEYYRDILWNIGWDVHKFNLVSAKDPNSFGTVDNLVHQVAATYLSGQELALFQQMVDSLNAARNEAAESLFSSSSISFNKANFQIGVASNVNGNATFKIGAYTYSAEQNITKVLFFTFGSQKIEFYSENQTMVLNEKVYSGIREEILEKLGNNAQDLVSGIDLI